MLTWNIDSTSKKKEKIFCKTYLLTAIHNSNITQTKGNNIPQKKVTSISAPVHDIQLHEKLRNNENNQIVKAPKETYIQWSGDFKPWLLRQLYVILANKVSNWVRNELIIKSRTVPRVNT